MNLNRPPIHEILRHACDTLEAGGILLYPADTIWGIGCAACEADAIDRVRAIKGREADKPLITLVHSFEALHAVVSRVHPRIDTLLQHHERPLTVIYPDARPPYRHLAAADGTIAVRLVRPGNFCHDLLSLFGAPVISTSANFAGEPAPSHFGSISSEIIRSVDYAVPAFAEKGITGQPSVIARYNAQGELDFLRTGINATD